jgi:hypothetical protein
MQEPPIRRLLHGALLPTDTRLLCRAYRRPLNFFTPYSNRTSAKSQLRRD